MSNFTFEIGENIKFYRKQRNMTLKELGCKVGGTVKPINKYISHFMSNGIRENIYRRLIDKQI